MPCLIKTTPLRLGVACTPVCDPTLEMLARPRGSGRDTVPGLWVDHFSHHLPKTHRFPWGRGPHSKRLPKARFIENEQRAAPAKEHPQLVSTCLGKKTK
eukprot:4844019-Pyramimonas_sp.AAC.1